MGLVLPTLHAVLCCAVPHGPSPSLTCVSFPGPSPATQGYCFEIGPHDSGWGMMGTCGSHVERTWWVGWTQPEAVLALGVGTCTS